MSTEYIKTSWQDGDIITADKMNNIENGIKDVEDTTTALKEDLTQVIGDLVSDAIVKAGIFINTSGVITTLDSSNPTRTICMQAKPNKTYTIKKSTSTIMRAGCGTDASLVSGALLTSFVKHDTASSSALSVTTSDANYYIYIQLFADSDSSDLKTVDANIASLIVYEDISVNVSKSINNNILNSVFSSIRTVSTLSHANTPSNYCLRGDGFVISSSNHRLYRYDISPQDILHIQCDAGYQFQYALGVPIPSEAETNEKLVGTPVSGIVDTFIRAPKNAHYLFLSCAKDTAPLVTLYRFDPCDVRYFQNRDINITYDFTSLIVNTNAIRNVTTFHADCKAICDASGGYLTQTLMGTDDWNNSMYYYKTNAEALYYGINREETRPVYPAAGGTEYARNLVLITSGIHGDEQQGDFAMYNFMYQLVNNRSNEVIKNLVKTTDFIFIPACCPTGIIDYSYSNRGNTNVNRSFPDTVSGSATCTEAGHIKTVIDTFGTDLTLHLDVHMFDAVISPYLAWTMTDSSSLGETAISSMYDVRDYWTDAYPVIKTFLDSNTFCSCVNTSTTSSNYTETVYDVPSGTIEALTELPILNTKNMGKDTIAYIFDEVVNTVYQFCKKYGV